MKKQIYLVRGMDGEHYEDFTRRVLQVCQRVAEVRTPEALKVTLTISKPPLISVIPFKKKKIAAISVTMDSPGPIPELEQEPGFSGAFSVTEAIPVAYRKTWKDGEATPGVGLLTLFHQKKGIDRATFLDRWHNGHTPLSLKLHPLWNYNRNVVEERLTGHTAWYDGIVEEHVRTRKDLLNIFRFFGKPHRVLYNMFLVYTDTNSFLDYRRIETYLVSEFHIIS